MKRCYHFDGRGRCSGQTSINICKKHKKRAEKVFKGDLPQRTRKLCKHVIRIDLYADGVAREYMLAGFCVDMYFFNFDVLTDKKFIKTMASKLHELDAIGVSLPLKIMRDITGCCVHVQAGDSCEWCNEVKKAILDSPVLIPELSNIVADYAHDLFST